VFRLPDPSKKLTHEQAGKQKKDGVLPERKKELFLHDQIEGDFRQKCQKKEPKQILPQIPGVKKTFHQKETKERKGGSSDEITEKKTGNAGERKRLGRVIREHTETGDSLQSLGGEAAREAACAF
jgi:hypothetical protein